MTNSPFFSICIPAYKRTAFLKKLLDSIAIQNFTDYEVVITDDSGSNEVTDFLATYNGIKNLRHIINPVALGTPENWNEAIRQARGTWIKLMHDDDWFPHENVLQHFYDAVKSHPEISFFFSAFQNIDSVTNQVEKVRCSFLDLFLLKSNPLHLFKKVYVGNPSCTLVKNDIGLLYDNRYKFVVDFEYYIRCFRKLKNWYYIDEILLSIGFNPEQVTKYTFRIASVQLPENHLLLNELGTGILHNFFVYDYYWRMYRNLAVRDVDEVKTYSTESLAPALAQMIRFQKNIPLKLLKIGAISKILMTLNYGFNLFRK
jgi:glycosyltransferase involved in cell wall biosynthesis